MESNEPRNLPQILKPSDISLTKLESTLIQNVHRHYAKIIIEKEFGGGYSGTRVFLILPVLSDDVTEARVVTKIGPADQLRQEKENSERISRVIPFSITQVREYYEGENECAGWAALNYIFAGGESLGSTMSLEEYYGSRPLEEVLKTLRELLGTVLGPNLYQKAGALTSRFRDEYGRHLPEPERLQEIATTIFPNLLPESDLVNLPLLGSFVNPLKVYPGLLNKTLEGRRSLVHGDLHLRNILVDQHGKGWLIDFGKVEQRHNLFDFIKLEVYIRIMALAPDHGGFSLREYAEFEQSLNAKALGRNVKAPSNAKLRFALDGILEIRRIAKDCAITEKNFSAEYFPALFLYLLATMKYYSAADDRPTRLVFVSACVLATEAIAPATQPSSRGIKFDFDEILTDYESGFETFIDPYYGAVIEHGRENGLSSFIYTEATAYAITDCLLLHRLTGKQGYLDRARTCAEWIRFAIDPVSGGVRTRYYFDKENSDEIKEDRYVDTSFSGRRIYAFDTAICIEALLNLYSHTNEAWLLDCAKTMGSFLLEKAISEEGTVVAVYDASTDACIPNYPSNEWSKQFGAFHTKVAQALTLLSRLEDGEKKTRYEHAATRICDHLIQKKFSSQGYFETSQDKIALHPLAYAAEGLFYVGLNLNRNTYISMARSIVVWLLKLSERYPTGELPQIISARDHFAPLPGAKFRTDSLAQIVALAADMHRRGYIDKVDFDKSEALVQKILEMKCEGAYFGKEGKESHLKFYRYGYYYHEKDTSQNGVEAKTLSYWTNAFCFQSLFKYHFSHILDEVVVMILAGGKGTRSWPLSCETRPKPLSKSILGDRSLLQETIRRYTINSFMDPKDIYIIANESSLAETCIQANEEGIPDANVIVDTGKEDSSIRAVIRGLQRTPSHPNGNRMIVVSMSDNLFEPCDAFQSALTTALLVAYSRPCVVSIGKPIDIQRERDSRFGHMRYETNSQIASYEAYSVNTFVEKPDETTLSGLANHGNNWAWECGTPVFREQYFWNKLEELIPQHSTEGGKLADDLLSKASSDKGSLNLVVALLRPDTRFDDFGVPGRNVFHYFEESGNANVIRGENRDVRALCCQGNLVISDALPIRLYGLTDYLIIDSAAANATVVMPLEKAGDLDNLYNSLGNQRPSKVFITGTKVMGKSFEINEEFAAELDHGQVSPRLREQFQKSDIKLSREASVEVDRPGQMWTLVDAGMGYCIQQGIQALKVVAEPVYRAAPECESAQIFSSYGCAVLSNIVRDNISLRRTRTGIVITNRDYPALIDKDFDNLLSKEREEPMIVRHLLDVSSLAEALLVPGRIALTGDARWLLGRLCLYHDYGGYLSERGVEKEESYIHYIRSITKIDRRLLDSRVLQELIDSDSISPKKEDNWLFNDHLNSAVELLRLKYKYISNDMRDILIFLLQNQEPPEQYPRFRAGYGDLDFAVSLGEVDSVFAVFKLAEIIANGKWVWKREWTGLLDGTLLRKTKIKVESFPEIIDYATTWIQRADIDPKRYIESLNHLIADDDPSLAKVVDRLQGDVPPLVCDRLYRSLLTEDSHSIRAALEDDLNSGLPTFSQEAYQRQQLINFPGLIEKIHQLVNIPALPIVKECIETFLLKNYSLFFKSPISGNSQSTFQG